MGTLKKNIAWLCDVDNYHKHDGNYAKCGDNDWFVVSFELFVQIIEQSNHHNAFSISNLG